MGFKLDGLDKYALRHNRTTLPSLQQQTQSKQVNILQAGDKHPHPPHIPNYLPAFPDPHAYIRTPVSNSACENNYHQYVILTVIVINYHLDS